ncbi:MAG: hypothetical protein QG635_2076, partial [Bacteroidota bacterium]|nr:hypothetical protein [Bacteroidota bacterium]
GNYICYNLDSVFAEFPQLNHHQEIAQKELEIPADSFLYSKEYKDYIKYKLLIRELKAQLAAKVLKFDKKKINTLIELNPEYYYTFYLAGECCFAEKDYERAFVYYKLALQKEIPTEAERKLVTEKFAESREKITVKRN